MNAQQETQKPDTADVHLVDLVSAALVDPELHTDARMRLHRELTELIETTRHGLSGREISEPPTPSREPADAEAPQVVAAHALTKALSTVLVDPRLHTDTRLRLHKQIPEMIRAAHNQFAVR
jgi:hypothetical protein